ncbi:MAG TPA: ribonuclease III [Candidatus Aminicenantes bacterium]|nr:ribonuclease III [Candidatus Aminicenantes bacterium]
MNIARRIKGLEKKIGYSFLDKKHLLTALTHSSYAYENQNDYHQNNEVYEFLGDAIIGFILADYLVANYPNLDEGDLSKFKAAAASTNTLASFARSISLDKKILLGKGEMKSKGYQKKSILAGAFEALVAAIYLDGGFEATQNFLLPLLEKFFHKIKVNDFKLENYKSALQEYLQRHHLPSPSYKIIETRGPEHKKLFLVEVKLGANFLAKAKGHAKKEAEQKAAHKALKKIWDKKIKSLSDDVFLMKRKE